MTRFLQPACVVLLLSAAAPGVHAGANLGTPEDDHDHGASFFGFVKDARGAPVGDAKVVLTVKDGLRLVMQTTKAGMYKSGNLSQKISPADVTISCAKDGYRQTRVIRRTARPEPNKPVEIECRMERG
jgi:hypothetical protein